jgi:hypothetical protein
MLLGVNGEGQWGRIFDIDKLILEAQGTYEGHVMYINRSSIGTRKLFDALL